MVSRRSPRVRARLTTSVREVSSGRLCACPTRDISRHGLCLDTAEVFERGAELELALLDADSGEPIEVTGMVVRAQEDAGPGIGVDIVDPPEPWQLLVLKHQGKLPARRTVRLRILVVGEVARQRGALALYVTSGWDIRFASDLAGATQALKEITLNAIVAEHDLDDPRWTDILSAARRLQPRARRIVRGALPPAATAPPGNRYDLVHRVVDRSAGLEALVDALTADLGIGLRGPG
jgi:hypothetical protein